MDWQAIKERLVVWREDRFDTATESNLTKVVLIVAAVYLLLAISVGMYWSMMPAQFPVQENAIVMAERSQQSVAVGSTTTAALIQVISTLLDKPGGFMSNDVMPPGLWLDNIKNWEYGVLIQSRDLTRALRESFSRSQSQSKEDSDSEAGKVQLSLEKFKLGSAFPKSKSSFDWD